MRTSLRRVTFWPHASSTTLWETPFVRNCSSSVTRRGASVAEGGSRHSTNTKMESPPRISMSEKEVPLRPSTLMEKRVSGSFRPMWDMFTDFLARLYTLRRAVGVPVSVNMVSNESVSVEKDSRSEGEAVKSSSMQEEATVKPIRATSVKSNACICLILDKRPQAQNSM